MIPIYIGTNTGETPMDDELKEIIRMGAYQDYLYYLAGVGEA